MGEAAYPALIPNADLDIHEHEHWAGLWNERICASIEADFSRRQRDWQSIEYARRPEPSYGVEYLYKYRAFDEAHPERTGALLADAKLWSASLHSLNDPMEGSFKNPDDALEAHAAFSFVYMMRSQWCGCISFSVDPVSQLMWGHYASDHSGFCLKYDRRDCYLLSSDFCQPVMYRKDLPKVAANKLTQLLPLVNLVFWTKSEAWEYEHEWRLRYPRTDAYTHSGLLKPSGVIFGLKTKPAVKDFIRQRAPNLQMGQVVTTGRDYS